MNCMRYVKVIYAIILCSFVLVTSHAIAEEISSSIEAGKLYPHYCAPCHGIKGDGKGFNARNLDPRPANHADAAFMTKRTDKELADAIGGGGRLVGKSSLMPPWRNTFSEIQVKNLVLYLRKLCRCEGR